MLKPQNYISGMNPNLVFAYWFLGTFLGTFASTKWPLLGIDSMFLITWSQLASQKIYASSVQIGILQTAS